MSPEAESARSRAWKIREFSPPPPPPAPELMTPLRVAAKLDSDTKHSLRSPTTDRKVKVNRSSSVSLPLWRVAPNELVRDQPLRNKIRDRDIPSVIAVQKPEHGGFKYQDERLESFSRAQTVNMSAKRSSSIASILSSKPRVEVVLSTMRELSRTPRLVKMRARLRESRSASSSSFRRSVVLDDEVDHRMDADIDTQDIELEIRGIADADVAVVHADLEVELEEDNEMDIDSGHSQHQDNRLYPAFVNSRLDIGGRERYDIQGISDVVPKSSHVTRQLMSKLYGGSPQGMFPTIHCSKLKDGVDNLGFINRDLNPYAPVLRGETGLFFFLNPQWIGQVPKRLFIRQTSSQWLYFGLYKFITAMPLTAAEFRLLEPKIQLGWVKHLFSKQWGRQFLVRIALRDENGGEEPSEEDIAAILGDKNTSKTYADKKRVTVEQVLRAFLSGKERLRVSCLKCIGYDLNWQKNLTEQSRQFDEENKARKAAKPHVPQEADPDAESEPVVPLPRAHGLPPKDTCKTQAGQQHTPLRPQGAEIWREVTIPQSARRELAVPQPARRKLAVPRPGSSGFPLLSNSHVQHSRSSRTPYSTAAIRARNSEYTAFAEISEQESADESDEIDKTQASSRHPPTKSRRPQELEAQRGLTALPTAWRESAASQPVRRKLAVPRSRSPGAPEHPWASTSNVQPLSRRELESKATRALALAGFGSDLSDLSELESADETDGGDENDVIVPDNSDVHDFDEDEAEEAMVKRLLGL